MDYSEAVQKWREKMGIASAAFAQGVGITADEWGQARGHAEQERREIAELEALWELPSAG